MAAVHFIIIVVIIVVSLLDFDNENKMADNCRENQNGGGYFVFFLVDFFDN